MSPSLLILYLMKIITPLKYFLKVILLKKFLKKLNFQKGIYLSNDTELNILSEPNKLSNTKPIIHIYNDSNQIVSKNGYGKNQSLNTDLVYSSFLRTGLYKKSNL